MNNREQALERQIRNFFKLYPKSSVHDAARWMNNNKLPASMDQISSVLKRVRYQMTGFVSAMPDKAELFNPPRLVIRPKMPAPEVLIEAKPQPLAPAPEPQMMTIRLPAQEPTPTAPPQPLAVEAPATETTPLPGETDAMKKHGRDAETFEARKEYAAELAAKDPAGATKTTIAAAVTAKFGKGLQSSVIGEMLKAARAAAGLSIRRGRKVNKEAGTLGVEREREREREREITPKRGEGLQARKEYLVTLALAHPDWTAAKVQAAIKEKFGKGVHFYAVRAALTEAGIERDRGARKQAPGLPRKSVEYEAKKRFAEDAALDDPNLKTNQLYKLVRKKFGRGLDQVVLREIIDTARSLKPAATPTRGNVHRIRAEVPALAGSVQPFDRSMGQQLVDFVRSSGLRAIHITVTAEGKVSWKVERAAVSDGEMAL